MHFPTPIPQYPPHTPYPSLPLDPTPQPFTTHWHAHRVSFHAKIMLLVIVDMHFVDFVIFSVFLYIFEQKVTVIGPLSSIIGTLSGRRGEEKSGSKNELIVHYLIYD